MKTILFSPLAILVALPAIASAQTSGTLKTQTAQSWTTAPWAITAGAGTFPDGGGVATWAAVDNTIVGTVAASTTVTLNAPITLSGITYNSPYSMNVAGTATNNLALTTSGATFNVQLSILGTPTLFSIANTTTAPITGGGAAGLTKTGIGTMTLGATVASSYTGGTHINGGTLVISATAAIGDSVFGASGAGNDISMDGGTLFNNITSGWTTNRNISLGAGGGVIFTNTAATINGVVSGNGSFSPTGFAAVVTTLTNTNTYLGQTITSGAAVSSLTLSGNGSIATTSGYDLAGTLTSNNATTNNNNRLSDTAPITMRGAVITMTGNAAAATAELAGDMTLANGINTVTVTPNAAQAASYTFNSITRQNNSTLFVRGTSLGATAGANVAQILSTASPGTLVGGGGGAGSTSISILPWAVGNTTAAGLNTSSLVTWDSTSKAFRPLATAEYSALTSGNSNTDNTRVTVATAITAPTTANSVVIGAAGSLLSGTGGLNVTSGAVLYAPGANTAGTISANINFGSAEGVLSNSSSTAGPLTVSGVLSGSGGLTVNHVNGGITVLTGANTYTGTTTLISGITEYTGNLANDGVTAGALGLATSAIVMNGGTATARLWSNTDGAVIDRNLTIVAGGPALVGIGTSGDTALTINGNITLNRALTVEGGTTLATATIINGNITGPGGINDNSGFGPFTIFNGNNNFGGGLNIQALGTYAAGSNTAFGTGTIFFSGAGFIQSADATAHTLVNNLYTSANPTFQGTGALTFTGGVNLNGSRSFAITNTAAAGVTLSGVVSNGALTKTGTGVLSLNSLTGNTYTGGTVLGAGAGTLNVNNTSGSGTGTGTVSIGGTTPADRSTLSGNFIISGATTDSGILSPGNSVGTATFGSTLTFTANTLVVEEISGFALSDKINVGGLLTLGGATFAVSTIGGYQAVVGETHDLVDWGSVAGTATLDMSGATLADPVNTMWDTSAFLTSGVITVVGVPEPSTMVLGTLAAGALGLLRRRKRKSA
jgi:fibronectin-binding autotransporter adhesin